MKKHIFTGILIIICLAYCFIFLGIEVELKSVLERPGAVSNQLIDSSFRIRTSHSIQLILFLIVVICSLYLNFKKKKI